MEKIQIVIISFVFVFLFIFFVINKKLRALLFEKKLKFNNIEIKIITIFKIILLLIFSVSVIFISWECIDYSLGLIDFEMNYKKQHEDFINNAKEQIKNENETYNNFINVAYNLENSKNPYIFDGFKHIQGEWNTGFVIEDENGNQFVWVPCTNISNDDGIEILSKKDFVMSPFIPSFECYNPDSKKFFKSALENGGFYVSRYEIGNEDGKAVSKKDASEYVGITHLEALKISEDMYDKINSSLINGYAYDTMYNWVINSPEFAMNDQKNISGLFNKIYEFTNEHYYTGIIYRGIIAEQEYINTGDLDNRLNSSSDYSDEVIGFRTIIYK